IDDPAEQILKFVAFHVGYHIVNRKQASVLMSEMRSLTPHNYRAIKELQRLYTDKVQELIERGCGQGKFRVEDSRIATFVLLQMLTSVARWYSPRGRLSVEELISVYTDLALAMVGAKRFHASSLAASNGLSSGSNSASQSILPVTH